MFYPSGSVIRVMCAVADGMHAVSVATLAGEVALPLGLHHRGPEMLPRCASALSPSGQVEEVRTFVRAKAGPLLTAAPHQGPDTRSAHEA